MILEAGTKIVANDLRYEPGDEPSIWRGSETLASGGPNEIARIARFAMEIMKYKNPDIALVGLGLGLLPRMIALPMDVWETEPEIYRWFVDQHPWLPPMDYMGHWDGEFDRKYDVIVMDHGYPFDEENVRAALKPGGIILK